MVTKGSYISGRNEPIVGNTDTGGFLTIYVGYK